MPNSYSKRPEYGNRQGKAEKPSPLYEQALAIKDSTATVLSNNQMAQIQSKYNIEKTELDQKGKTTGSSSPI
jgi:hypothetical protein